MYELTLARSTGKGGKWVTLLLAIGLVLRTLRRKFQALNQPG